MSEFNKYSTDGGATFIDVEDSNAVHWADNTVLGAKNFLNHNAQSTSQRGIVFTVNADKTISLSGALNTSTVTFLTLVSGGTLPAGNYKLTGCPLGGAQFTYSQAISITHNGTSTTYRDTGNGVTFPFYDGDTYNIYSPRIDTGYLNKSLDGLIFKPMISLASDTDDTYALHAMTNRELTDIAQHNNNPTVIATANANQKWSEQLSALYTEYQKYSMNQRRKMFISYDDITGWNFINSAPTFGTFAFNNVVGSINSMEIFTLRLSNQKAYDAYFKTDGTVTVTDMSEQTNVNALKLCIV